MNWLHSSSAGGHSGHDSTATRIKYLFFWKGMSKDIQHFVRNCRVCQTCKYETAALLGLLQLLI